MTTQLQNWKTTIRRGADELRRKSAGLQQVRPDHGLDAGLDATMARMDRPFVLAVVGEFRSGKSTLINALLEDEVALTGSMETTPIAIEYAWGEKTEAEVAYRNGRSEVCPVQDLNRYIDEHRHDQSWLETVQRCGVTVPSPLLKEITLWDSPGFGGSDHYQERAETFLKNIDAALWVFDVTVLGQSALSPLLADLRRRGKPVVALLNKADVIPSGHLDRATAYIGRAYKEITFERIMPFSATRAFQPVWNQDGHAASPELSDGLPADGGRQALIDYLQNELLVEPELLRLRGVAGDLGHLALSAAEDFNTAAAHLDRKLYVCRRNLEQTAEHSLQIRNELSVSLREELPLVLEDASIEQIEEMLKEPKLPVRLALGKLKGEIQCRLSASFYEDQIKTYFGNRQADIEAAWNRMGQELDLRSSLEAPFEFLTDEAAGLADSLRDSLSTLPEDGMDAKLQEITTAGLLGTVVASSIGTILAGSSGHVIIATICATLGSVVALPLLGLIVCLVRDRMGHALGTFVQDMGRNFSDKLREKLRGPIRSAANTITEMVVDPYLLGIHEAVVKHYSVAICLAKLNGRTVEAVSQSVEELRSHASDCRAIHEHLRGISQVELPPPSEEPVILRADHRTDGERWFRQIFDEAGERIVIVDRDLGPGALELLRLASDIVPIQVLTYTHPMSSGLVGPFREAAGSLRQRPGSVRIRVPFYEQNHECPLKDNTCWIFTGEYCYHLDRSLNRFGSEDIAVEVARNTGAQFDAHFARWWENRVEGVPTVDF